MLVDQALAKTKPPGKPDYEAAKELVVVARRHLASVADASNSFGKEL